MAFAVRLSWQKTNELKPKKKKPGGDLLSHTLVCSTIGDEELDF